METINWMEILDWTDDQIEDLRFVGYSYLKQGKYDIAQTFFEAIAILSNEAFYDLQTLGAIYLQNGHYLQALNNFDRALKQNPNHAETLLNKANALFLLGYKKQGITQAKTLIDHENKNIANQATALLLSNKAL